MEPKLKIAIVASHPIEHCGPQYASFAKSNEIEFDHLFLDGQNVLTADKNMDASSLDVALSSCNPQLIIIYVYFQKLQTKTYRWAT